MSYLDDVLSERLAREGGSAREHPEDKYVWWLACDDEEDEYVQKQRASSLIQTAQNLETVQQEVHQQNLWSAQLYSNRELAAFDWGSGNLVRASLAPVSRLSENIVVRLVDTLVSQIGKNKPKAKPQARGACFTTRQNVKKLDKFLYGEWQQKRLYAHTKRAFRDACIFSFGCVKVICEKDDDGHDRVDYERVFPDEILVDQMEIVATGKIRHFYRRRVLPIEVICATYGVTEEQLADVGAAGFNYLDHRPVGRGYAVVVEGYQTASGRTPGRWMVATHNLVLDEGKWEHEWLPYVFYHWQDPVSGFYSASVVEQCIPYQIRLNEINDVIRDAQDLMARPRILVAEGSRVNPMEVDNVIGRFIKYTGIKPEAVTWSAVNAELYNERERLVAQCLEQFGVSQLASSVTPPPSARFDSSPAFREFNAIQDDRLSDPAERHELFHLDLAQRTIDVISASGANPKTVWYAGWKQSKAEEINWKDIALEADSFMMTMEAVSIFNMSPAAARDELEKQLAMGMITPEQYRLELSDMDQEGAYTLAAAAAQDLNRVQELLEAGEFEAPIPQQDLVNGIEQMTMALLNLNKYKNVKPETKLNFINWITLAEAIAELGTEKVDATMPPAGGEIDPMTGMPMGPDPSMGMGGGLGGAPGMVPVPEAAGLAAAGPGAMPNIT